MVNGEEGLKKTLGAEHLAPLMEIYSPREIMRLFKLGAEERYRASMSKALTRFEQKQLTRDAFLRESSRLAGQRAKEMPFTDPLTGAYGRGDLYTFLSICFELGHNEVEATIFDMDFLKDYNSQFGEPTGGDYTLTLTAGIAEQVAKNKNKILVRYQGEGGDDFILLGFPEKSGSPEDAGKMIEDSLAQITSEQFFSGNINGKAVVRHSTQKPIILNPQLVGKIKSEKPELLPILIPPKISHTTIMIKPSEDISLKRIDSGIEYYDFDSAAVKVEEGFAALKDIKSLRFNELSRTNLAGVALLARGSK